MFGRAAIRCFAYHDENGNGALERSFLGIPKEGVALSNNARGHLGPPKLKDARFEHKEANETLTNWFRPFQLHEHMRGSDASQSH
jgi:uncharacterized protein (DUF2141 family)